MFAGSLVALVTPMESNGDLALDAFDRLLTGMSNPAPMELSLPVQPANRLR